MAKKRKVFIVLTHHRVCHPDEGKHNLVEKAEFVDNLKSRHIASATIILDFIKETIVKQREGNFSYAHYISHVRKTYPQQITELEEEYKT